MSHVEKLLNDTIAARDAEIERLKQAVTKSHLEYAGIVSLHAQLMLDTLCRDDIEHELDFNYPWSAPIAVTGDVRTALNVEMKARARLARKQSQRRKPELRQAS